MNTELHNYTFYPFLFIFTSKSSFIWNGSIKTKRIYEASYALFGGMKYVGLSSKQVIHMTSLAILLRLRD